MTYRVTHLNKSGFGMASETACGRNVVRTPISTNWADFKTLPESQQCEKCAASKQAALNAKADANKWVPEDRDYMEIDRARIAEIKAMRAAR